MDIQNSGAAPERVDFSKIKTSIPIPNLIEVQKNSYERFLQMDLLPNEREDTGLQTVFSSVFPISDFRGVSELEFVDYSIGNWECKCGNLKGLHHLRSTCRNCGATIRTDPFHAGDVLCHHCGTFNKNVVTFCNKCGDPVGLQLKYDMVECQERGMTYAAPLKVTIRLTVYAKDPATGVKSVRDIKEQEVFFGEIPLMTDNGTFIINGTERVIVSQLHRSPGVFFERVPAQGYFLGKIIPYRGSWVEFEYDTKNLLYVRIDRKRKFYGSVFLRALGFKTDEQMLHAFYTVDRISIKDNKLYWNLYNKEGALTNGLTGLKLSHAIMAKSGETLVGQGKKITSTLLKSIAQSKIQQTEIAPNDLEGAYIAADVVDMATGEVLIDANHELTTTTIQQPDRSRHRRLRSLLPRARRSRHRDLRHAAQRQRQGPERSADRNLSQAAPRRSAHPRHRHAAVPGHVLRPAQVRFLARGPHEVQHQAARQGRSHAARQAHPRSRGFPRHHQVPAEAAQRHRRGRRYRSPGQPPRARRGRIARKPVPHRPGAHGARHQREDVRLPGNVHGHAARPGERQAGHGRHPRILRIQPALAVHGSDQSALGDHAQAASFRAGTGRSVPRARRIRSPRRAPHALRPHLPHRDAGRPEHRADLVALLLCPHQRVRLHRKPLPQGA